LKDIIIWEDTNVKKFGDRLKELRLQRKLSQQELAKYFNTGKASICNYEKNIRLPDANTITQYAQYFGVTVDYMLGLTENKGEDLTPPDKYVGIIARAKTENISPERLSKLLDFLADEKRD
jgi:transcriptional regulator with XRE-family HTH domain